VTGVARAEVLVGNPRDGYLDRLVSRRLSPVVTRLLLPTPITPNAVTVFGTVVGVAGGLLIGSAGTAGIVAGVLCLLASGVLDCSDGELARLRGESSRLGHVLDIAGDTVVSIALLAGIVLRLTASGQFPGWPALLTLSLGVAAGFAVITACEATEARRHRVACWENRVLDGVLGPLTTRDWYVFPVVFALAGRLAWLVPAAAAGAHVFWPVTLALLLRVLRAAQLQGSAARVRQ
jgi:phosphatidylglycerophosphate synthase